MVEEANRQYKLGKKPAVHDPHQFQLAHFEKPAPPKPAQVGYDSTKDMNPVPDWGMLANDRLGDCVIAGSEHETMILTFEGMGTSAAFNSSTAISDYSAITGYNPSDPNSDEGTDMGTAMKYRRKTGMIDAARKRHKIGAYIALEPGNWNQMLQGLAAFTVVGMGFMFPDYAMNQFNEGLPWTVVAGAPDPDEGHYVPVVAFPKKGYIEIITWAKKQLMSKGFYQKYNDEAYVFVSEEDLKAGKSPSGYDLSELNSIITSL